jgi:membrane associated rhomboid family serine protease
MFLHASILHIGGNMLFLWIFGNNVEDRVGHVLFPDAPIRTIIIFYLILFRDISAKWLLAFWFVSQFFVNPNEGVAWVAHVGGFIFGALVALLLRRRLPPPVPRRAAWEY